MPATRSIHNTVAAGDKSKPLTIRQTKSSSIMAATLLQYGISQRVLWNTGSTVVRQYIWDLCSSNAAAEPPSVAEKTWDSERVWLAGGYTQVAAEMKCAFKGVDERGLVVVPTEYNISVSEGMSVFYPYAGTNLTTRFCLLRTNKSPSLLTEVNVAAVHLGWGLQDVHNKNLVLRDCKSTNALFLPGDGVYRWSDAGLSCTTGSRSGGGDDSRPAPDHLQRYGNGRVCDSARMLSMTNDGALDVYAYGVVLYEAVTGEVPPPTDINRIHDYIGNIPGYSEQQLWAMDSRVREEILLEAMFDRSVAMLEHRVWWDYVRDYIAPRDIVLARFLTRIFRPREERAPLEELLQHEYITRISAQEEAHIQRALPAWRARVQAAGEVAKVVKLARALEATQHLQQQSPAPHPASCSTSTTPAIPTGSSSSSSSQVMSVRSKQCGSTGSGNSTAEQPGRCSGDTCGSTADQTDQLGGLDNSSTNSSSSHSSDIKYTSRQQGKGWGSCSNSSSSSNANDVQPEDSTAELPGAVAIPASPNQQQPQALIAHDSIQVQEVLAAAATADGPTSVLTAAACTRQQQQQAIEQQEQLQHVGQQQQDLEQETCLLSAWLAVQQLKLQEAQAVLGELQQQVEATEAANAAAQEHMSAYKQRLAGSQGMVIALEPPSRPAAAAAAGDRAEPASRAQGGWEVTAAGRQQAACCVVSCYGSAAAVSTLCSHPIVLDDDFDDFVD